MAETTVPAKSEEQELAPTREESRHLAPPVDIYETTDALVVVADVPGATRETVDINVEDGLLTIKAKPEYESRGDAYVEEFGLVNFYRQFQLPDAVDQEKITAQYKHGVLTITLPKAEAAKPKQIAVNVG
jgi:HSP20 family molecular chaperone IbpA